MLAGHRGERLRAAVIELYGGEPKAAPPAPARRAPRPGWREGSEAEEKELAALCELVEQILAALSARPGRSTLEPARREQLCSLGGAEWAGRVRLAHGADSLAALVPSCAYVASLAYLELEPALALAAACEALVAAAEPG